MCFFLSTIVAAIILYLPSSHRPIGLKPSILCMTRTSYSPVTSVITKRPVSRMFYQTPSQAICQIKVSNQSCKGNLVFAAKLFTIAVIVHFNYKLITLSIPIKIWATTIATITQTIPTISINN